MRDDAERFRLTQALVYSTYEHRDRSITYKMLHSGEETVPAMHNFKFTFLHPNNVDIVMGDVDADEETDATRDPPPKPRQTLSCLFSASKTAEILKSISVKIFWKDGTDSSELDGV